MKKILLLAICGFTVAIPASAQFGKLKGLVNKDKTEKVQEKSENSSPKTASESSYSDLTEASTDNSKINPKTWSLEFDGNIDWFKLSPTGKVIAATNSGLYGIDPSSGKIAWKHEILKNLTTENYNPISNSPFIAIVTGGIMNMQQIILDVSTGKIIADTKNMGLKMVNKRYTVPSLGGIIFTAYVDNSPSIIFVDAISGEKKWVLKKIFESANEMLVAKPLSIDEKSILMATGKRLYRIDVKSGTVIWNTDFKTETDKGTLATEVSEEVDDKESTKAADNKGGGLMGTAGNLGKLPGLGSVGKAAGAAGSAGKLGGMGGSMRDGMAKAADAVYGKFLILDQQPDIAYYYSNENIVAFDLASGKLAWEPVKFPDPLAGLLFHETGFVITTNDKRAELLLLDYKTGKQKWNPVTLKGQVTALKLNGNNLALASAKESGNNYVNIIDINTGIPVSKSEMKVSGQILDIRQNKQGLIYRTNKELNIQDIETGKDVWAKSLSYKIGGGIGVDKGDKTYFWADNQLHIMDNTNGEYKAIGKALKFGNDEIPDAIEIREKGVLVSSSQNLALFDWDGNKIYHVFKKAPGTSLANKIMNVAAIAISVSNSASQGFQAGLAGTGTSSYNSHMASADRWSNLGSAAASDMNRRFKASQDAKNYKVILTDIEGAEGGYGLVRVNKDTGAVEAKVVLKDKKPDYLSDDSENLIFYKESSKTITGYNL